MLSKMTVVLQNSPSNTTQEVEVTARAVAGLTQRPDELSSTAQVQNSSSVAQCEHYFKINALTEIWKNSHTAHKYY